MKRNNKLILVVFMSMIAGSLSCKALQDKASVTDSDAPKIDFTVPGKGLDVKIQLDKNQSASGKIGKAGGSVSLTGGDGSKFTLEIPADALDAETTITMTAVKSLDGSPLDKNTPTAVQLEPSGLFFKQLATLTIVPAKEIPVKEQIVFGYEGDGKDYSLAVVDPKGDPKSKDIKIKLMRFSGAGVGSGSDAAWAATLMLQASTAESLLFGKLGEYTQELRRRMILGDENSAETAELTAKIKAALEQYEEQVVLKEIVAAELDCKHAEKAIKDLLYLERLRSLLGFPPTPTFDANAAKLYKIASECQKSYHVEGTNEGASFKGDICSLTKPFVINVDSQTGSWPMNFTPESESAGQMSGEFSAGGCTLKGGGPYTVTVNEDGSGTLKFTYTSTATCPAGSRTTSKNVTLQMKATAEINCK